MKRRATTSRCCTRGGCCCAMRKDRLLERFGLLRGRRGGACRRAGGGRARPARHPLRRGAARGARAAARGAAGGPGEHRGPVAFCWQGRRGAHALHRRTAAEGLVRGAQALLARCCPSPRCSPRARCMRIRRGLPPIRCCSGRCCRSRCRRMTMRAASRALRRRCPLSRRALVGARYVTALLAPLPGAALLLLGRPDRRGVRTPPAAWRGRDRGRSRSCRCCSRRWRCRWPSASARSARGC